jgi:hypothetical protein
MTPAEFDDRLQRCLDERRDPFLDAELAEHLALDPEAAVRTAELLQRLEVVALPVPGRSAEASMSSSPRAKAPHRRVAAIAAAAAILAFAFAARGARETESPGRVLRANLRTLDERPLATTVTVRTVLVAERGLHFQTFDQRAVRR